jgi:hypothetical protein
LADPGPRPGTANRITHNKAQAHAYILTSKGFPCVFYYSSDPDCHGLKKVIDNLLWIHHRLADGPHSSAGRSTTCSPSSASADPTP